MKRIVLYTLFALSLGMLLWECDDQTKADEILAGIQFRISLPQDSLARIATDTIHDVTEAIMSINTIAGENILVRQKLKISWTSDGLLTEKLKLAAGKYVITNLFLSDGINILYASPQRGSLLAKELKHPMTYAFGVTHTRVSTLNVGVIDIDGHAPEDFGYGSFDQDPLKFFSLGVHTLVNGKYAYAASSACILRGVDTLVSYDLPPAVSLMKFNCKDDDELKLVVIRDGFARYIKSFKFPELLVELNKKPLVVDLSQAVTLSLHTLNDDTSDHLVQFDINTNGVTTLTIDWGDGEVEQVASSDTNDGSGTANAFFDHTYHHDSVDYFISITGDFQKILAYSGDYNTFDLSQLNVTCLPSLKVVDLSASGTSGVLDLRQNPLLEIIKLGADSVLLPKKHAIHDVRLFSDMATSLDIVIGNVYSNANALVIKSGSFNFSAGTSDHDSNEMIAVPSSTSASRLGKLRTNLLWDVYPSF